LHALNLHTDFLNKILNSAQTTTARVLRAAPEIPLEHIHLLVFAPSNRASKRQTWGFFSVERLEDTKEGAIDNDHTIKIYVYLEGDDVPAR
jgi:hypothetical protein